MATDQDGVEDDEPAAGSAYQPTTTKLAQKYAQKILDRNLAGGDRQGEDQILGEFAANNKSAVDALKAAQQSIAAQSYNPQLAGLSVAAALGKPTHSGSTSESISSGFGALHDELANAQKFGMDQTEALAKYGIAIPDEQQKLVQAKLDLQKLHEQQEGPLARSALTTLGRGIAKSGAGSAGSPFGKIASDEGLEPGTPAFTARVHQLAEMDLKDKAARAGADADDMSDDERAQLADQYGVPSTAPYPWRGMSTRQKTAAMQTERSKGLTELEKSDQAVGQDQAIKRDLDRFLYLNERTKTSSLQGVPGIHFLTGFGDDAKEMDKISSRLGPLMRQPGMGRMTNLDLTTFMASTVGRDKPIEVNRSIRTAQNTAIDNALAYNEYAHNYFAVHQTLQGAREAWDRYLDKNPNFDPASKAGSFKANPNRQDYKDYFRSQGGTRSAPAAASGPSVYPDVNQTDRDDPTFAGLTDEEIHNSKKPALDAPGKARGGRVRGFAEGGKVKDEDDYKATLEDLARSLEQGATFQWGDEANAGVTPGSYAQNVQSERGQQERFGAHYPVANTGLEIGGGAASGYAAGKLGKLALEKMKGAGGKAATIAALLEKYAPKNIVTKSATVGAGTGALAGAGSAQDMQSVPGTALEQGAIGAAAGPLAGLTTKYGVNGAMALLDKITGKSIPAGSQKVIKALGQDQTTVDEIQARLNKSRRLGVPSNVGDVGGPNVQALATGVATKPGPKVGQYVQGLDDRQDSANERVSDLVNKALKPDDYTTKLSELTTNMYQNAKPLYQQAYAQFPKVKSNVIYDILDTPSGAKAAKQAFKLMQDAGEPIGQPDVTGAVKKPSLQYLDYVKRSLDDMVEKNERAGNMNQARVIRTMRNNLRDELDTVTQGPNGQPGFYQQARAQYAGDLEVLDALKMGRDDFGKMTSRDLTNATAGMSFAEKDALRTGAAENLFQQVASTSDSTNPASKLAGNQKIRDKVRTLFDTDADYNKFMDGLTQEMHNFNQSRQIIATATRSRASDAASDLSPTGHMGEAAYDATLGAAGHGLWMGARAAKFLGNKLMPSDTAEGAADILGTTSAKGPLDILKAHANQLQNRVSMSDMAGLTSAGAASGALAPDPWSNMEQPPEGAQ